MKRKIAFCFLFAVPMLLNSCSNPLGSSQSSVDRNFGKNALPVPTGFEAVSGSQIAQKTNTVGRIADVTVGAQTGSLKLKTQKNRTVFLSVQGQMISNQ